MSETETPIAAPASNLADLSSRFQTGETIERQDSRGRTLKLKQLSLLEEMNLLAAAGGERAENRRWMMYATMVCCVRQIDGVPVPRPDHAKAFPNTINLVGAEGVAAVAELLAAGVTNNADSDDAGDAAKN